MCEKTVEESKEFDLVDDYKSKVAYLKDHFTRMWTRFNFFLTIHSAMFAAIVLKTGNYEEFVAVFGVILSILWYVFGAQDRYLVALYRAQIEDVWIEIIKKYENPTSFYVGQTNDYSEKIINSDTTEKTKKLKKLKDIENSVYEGKKNVFKNIYQWRGGNISTTKLASLFPIIIGILWIAGFFLLTKYKASVK